MISLTIHFLFRWTERISDVFICSSPWKIRWDVVRLSMTRRQVGRWSLRYSRRLTAAYHGYGRVTLYLQITGTLSDDNLPPVRRISRPEPRRRRKGESVSREEKDVRPVLGHSDRVRSRTCGERVRDDDRWCKLNKCLRVLKINRLRRYVWGSDNSAIRTAAPANRVGTCGPANFYPPLINLRYLRCRQCIYDEIRDWDHSVYKVCGTRETL